MEHKIQHSHPQQPHQPHHADHRVPHKKHHLPVIALAIVFLLLALVTYFALFFQRETAPDLYAPKSSVGAAEGGL